MRIVSLAPSNTEILYALGAENEIVGVTRFCDYPPEVRNKPKIGGWLDLDYKKIKELEPDLAITSTFVQEKVVSRLEDVGIEVLHVDPITLSDVYESMLDIGHFISKEKEAVSLVSGMKERMSNVNQRVKLNKKIKIYAEEWHQPPTVCGNWVPDLIEMLGCASLGKNGEHSREVNVEEVSNFDPDLMIVSWCGFGKGVDLDLIKKRKDWENVKAIKNGKIYVFDDSLLNRPGPRLIEGLEIICEVSEGIGMEGEFL